jgi:hypothetical protein
MKTVLYICEHSAFVKFETKFDVKVSDLLKLKSCNMVDRHQQFGGKCCLHLQIIRVPILFLCP